MKKPKLSQALASYSKKQAEKAKAKVRNESMEAVKRNKAAKMNISINKDDSRGKAEVVKAVEKPSDHVPCHIWTDSSKMQKKTRLPFHPKGVSSILLIGEGDFSYCCALVRAFISQSDREEKSWRIVATALDSRETVLRKYRKAAVNLKFLEEVEGVEVFFGVDGTKLHENRELKQVFHDRPLTRVIFNFPHTGAGIKDRERNIVAQQKMLKEFFESTLKFIETLGKFSSNGCKYTTTMIKKNYAISDELKMMQKKKPAIQKKRMKDSDDDEGSEEEDEHFNGKVQEEFLAYNAKIFDGEADELQSEFDHLGDGESFEIHCTFKTGDPYDAWKPKALASSTGKLVCLQSFRFCPELYSGYQHCRTVGDGGSSGEIVEVDSWKEFLAGKPAKTFVFTLKN